VAVISPGVQHSGTPAEVVDRAELERIARLLADYLGAGWREPPPGRAGPAGSAVTPTPAGQTLSPFALLIQQLVEIYGVSGAEHPVRAWIHKQLPDWARQRSAVDEQDNLVVRLGRGEKPGAIFIAHMDEIGFEVPRNATDRVVPAESRGGGMADLFAWHPFWVHTQTRRLAAVMTRHGSLDIGAPPQQDSPQDSTPRVAGGDTATVPKRFQALLGNRMTARSLDDRIGCAVLLAVLLGLDEDAVRRLGAGSPVWFVFSVEEESGLVGARHVAERTAPRRVYPVDSFVTSDSPLEEKRLADARLGEGFVLRAMDSSGITPRAAVERVDLRALRCGQRSFEFSFALCALAR
jgi:putative aminopeptidase FrvX